MKYFLIILVSILSLQCSNNTEPEKNYDVKGIISKIEIEGREHGYNNFSTTIIKDSISLNNFINNIQNENGWNDKDDFIRTISEEGNNLEKNNLLLFRHTETSGSIEVKVASPYISNGIIKVELNRTIPSIGSDDMAFYCYAYMISKDVALLEFVIENIGKEKVIIP